MKINITGASHFINRMFEACGNYQWAREFLKNSLEAQATRIEFGIEWQAVEKHGIYRRTVIDNGIGMNREELTKFFSTLGEGGKKIGGLHENFGVGAKIASLPWNPEGVIVISYKNSQGSMIWIVLDEDSGDYELMEFEIDGNRTCVIDPSDTDPASFDPLTYCDIDWSAIRPDWLQDQGTIVVLLGSEDHRDTILGNPNAGEKDIKGLSVYLNSRFWDLSAVEVVVAELRSEKKTQWPQSANDKDNSRRANNRQIRGARFYLIEVDAKNGGLNSNDIMFLDNERVAAEWYLWSGERPHIDSYAKKSGYIAIRYNGELFQLTSSKIHFRWFGIIESKVQQNLTVILEPQHYNPIYGGWGIHPDQSRNRLIFTGDGGKGVDVPLSDWGLEFAENLPEPILNAIYEARGDIAGSIKDEEYRKRLQDRFGDRWKTKILVKANKEDSDAQGVETTSDDIEIIDESKERVDRIHRKRKKAIKVIRKLAQLGEGDQGVERETPVDVPFFNYARCAEFEKPWHLALWAPLDQRGPTVYINIESPILMEIVKYHQDQYPDVYAEEVEKTVHQVFGEVAACKIAHSQKLLKDIPEEELNTSYRSEQSLTVALMGLMAEESVISQRLAKLGRKKADLQPNDEHRSSEDLPQVMAVTGI